MVGREEQIGDHSRIEAALTANMALRFELQNTFGENHIPLDREIDFMRSFFGQDIILPPIFFLYKEQSALLNEIYKKHGYTRGAYGISAHHQSSDICFVERQSERYGEIESYVARQTAIHEWTHGIRKKNKGPRIVTNLQTAKHGDFYVYQRENKLVRLKRSDLAYSRDIKYVGSKATRALLNEAFTVYVETAWNAAQMQTGGSPWYPANVDPRNIDPVYEIPLKYLTLDKDGKFSVSRNCYSAMALEQLFDYDPKLRQLLIDAKFGGRKKLNAFYTRLQNHFGNNYIQLWIEGGSDDDKENNRDNGLVYLLTKDFIAQKR